MRTLAALPPLAIYVVLGVGAATENLIPPIPADTFVLLGAFLAAAGRADLPLVFLCTWLPNVISALIVYGLARRFGEPFFRTGAGHWLLRPRQLRAVNRFYRRWGTPAIFFSRFLPAFRAVVPVFAGVSAVPLRRVALPVTVASAVWYGFLVWLGAMAGRNWSAILGYFDRTGRILLGIALVLLGAVAVWWFRTRRRES